MNKAISKLFTSLLRPFDRINALTGASLIAFSCAASALDAIEDSAHFGRSFEQIQSIGPFQAGPDRGISAEAGDLADFADQNTASEYAGETVAASGVQSALIRRAKTQLQSRYTRGGASPETGFDCSGFIKWAYADLLAAPLPHSALAQYQLDAPRVKKANLQPGDLMFFKIYGDRVSHVVMYLGGGKMIHATRPGARLRIESMEMPYWQRSYVGANRPLASDLVRKDFAEQAIALLTASASDRAAP